MSIIMGPYDNGVQAEGGGGGGGKGNIHQETAGEDVDDLLVFGYACKQFRDDDKALLENSGQLLIPWMGDGSLMIDRYDLRNRLEDKSQFGLKPILPRRKTQGEEDLEEMLDKERYLAMGVDILEHELMEEEGRKRQREEKGGYTAVGFTYSNHNTPQEERGGTSTVQLPLLLPPPSLPEHPPTSTVDVAESEAERFIPPTELVIPGHIQQPVTKKLHSIIEKTAGFVAKQGTQMEIVIKAKQKHNPLFSFLSLYDPLHTYYRLLLQLISSGRFTPSAEEDTGDGGGGGGGETKPAEETEKDGEESDSEDEDSDGEGFELHPLLRVSTTPRSSPRPSGNNTTSSSSSTTNLTRPITSTPTTTTTPSSFVSKSLSVNAAPSLDLQQQATGRGEWRDVDYYQQHQDYPPPHPSLLSSQQQLPVETGRDSRHYPHYQTSTDATGYSLHPQASDFTSQRSLEAYYHRVREEHLQNKMAAPAIAAPLPSGRRDPGPPPPPPDLQPVVDKTAEYVARNSEEFERTVLERHCGDPKFGFLNPWNQYYSYYKFRLQLNKERVAKEGLAAMERDLKQRREASQCKQVQKLNQSGGISFKLQAKKKAVLEVEGVDLGSVGNDEEEEEEEEETESNGVDIVQQVQDGYDPRRDEREGNGVSEQQEPLSTDSDPLVYYSHHHQVHYSAGGTVYRDERTQEEGGGVELAPPTKRAKTDDEEDTERVMDNKVQEFLSEVKAVLDT